MPDLSPLFWRWFGQSKIVHSDGTPMVLYHGSEKSFTSFDPEQYDIGIFLVDDPKLAQSYAFSTTLDPFTDSNGGIYQLYVKMEKPFVYDAKGASWDDIEWSLPSEELPETRRSFFVRTEPSGERRIKTDSIAIYAQAKGFDGVIIHNVRDPGRYYIDVFEQPGTTVEPHNVYIVFDPRQLKSAYHNVGTYDGDHVDLRRNPFVSKMY